MKLFDNEGKELNPGDKVVFCMDNVNRTAWLYELKRDKYWTSRNVHRALFSMTDPNSEKGPTYMGYEWVADNDLGSSNVCTRAIKI